MTTYIKNLDVLKRQLGLEPMVLDESRPGHFHLPCDVLIKRGVACQNFYLLLTKDNVSLLHQLDGAQIYHFCMGDAVELLQLSPCGEGQLIIMGHKTQGSMKVQHTVPPGSWQGARLAGQGEFALIGMSHAPLHTQICSPWKLASRYPAFTGSILALSLGGQAG